MTEIIFLYKIYTRSRKNYKIRIFIERSGCLMTCTFYQQNGLLYNVLIIFVLILRYNYN